MTILVDGDLLIYKASAAAETEVHWGDGLITLQTNLDDAISIILADLGIYQELDIEADIEICLSSNKNFRKDIDPTYKENRKGTRKPLGYSSIVEYLKNNYLTVEMDGLEADDVMGILQTTGDHNGIIVSEDKDMLQIPGRIYNPRSGELCTVSVEEGDYYHLHQTLVGDRTDNYPGCPGIGEVKARAVLSGELGPTWDAVRDAFEHAGLTEEDALRQARLAKILRAEDYDPDEGEVKLWKPASTVGVVSTEVA